MKRNVFRAVLCAFLATNVLLGLAVCASADIRQNLDKYWLYRDIQRDDFVVPGIGQGYSLVACFRNTNQQHIHWGDTTIDLGWYIGALATEYYMLTHPETFPGYVSGGGDLTTCTNELYWAISAMDRVDANAEICWDPYAPDTPGFFIRDDVPADFYQHFPGMSNLGSDYSHPDPWIKEMSIDQVCHVLLGLSLAKKLLPSDLVVNGKNLRQSAITRGLDVLDWVHQNGWIVYNPVTNIHVNRGEDARAFAKGYNRVCGYLSDGTVNLGDGPMGWVWDTLNSPSNPAYDNRNNRHMAMAISACGNGWGDSTLNDLMSLADAYDWYAYPMLYAIVHDSVAQSRSTWPGHQATINSWGQTMLNNAPATRTPRHPRDVSEENTGWCGSRKFIVVLDEQNHGAGDYYEDYPGLDYLLLHNLFYILTPSLWQDPTPAPGQATNPSPAGGATGVSVTPTLSWTGDPAATSHDVYLGTSNPPPFVQNQGGTTYNPATLNQNTTYYWRIDEKNDAGTTTGNVWSFTTVNLPPGPVTNFNATAGNGQISLSWTNPGSDFAGTMIRYSTVGYPGGPTGGTLLYNGTGTSKIHTGLSNGVTYYYSAFTYDAQQNYSSAVTRNATPAGAFCFSDSFAYPNGALVGNGEWSGTATASQIEVTNGTIKLNGGAGSYDAVKQVYCQANGSGYIPVTIKLYSGTGGRTIWNLWINDGNGLNLARWYGTANSARGRIGETSDVTAEQTLVYGQWNTLTVRIYPSTNTSQFFFNGADIGTLSHASQGSGDIVARIRLERIDNWEAVGHFLTFDDLQIGEDITPPGPVTNFVATSGDMQNVLTWTNPGSDYAGTMIRFSTVTYPGSPQGGTQCYNGTGTTYTHTGLTNGVTYYYSAFAYDGTPNYSGAAIDDAVPADTTAPGPVTGFTATAGNAQNVLAWTNPGGDFTGTMIRWKTGSYPTGPADGAQCYSGSGTGYTHTGLTNGVTYYYCAYAHDEVPNYASAAQSYATPFAAPAFCFQDEFNYPEGVALVGQGGWTGNATNAHIKVTNSLVQVYGGSQARNATKTMTCSGGPYIWVRLVAYQGVGTSNMWNVWINDSGGKNFARWYGAGTTARGRIGTSSTVTASRNLTGGGMWDSLVVKIDPAANTSQFFFNGEDLGVYSHGTQPGSAVGQIVIERENNGGAAGHHMYLDNIRVSQS